MSHECRNIMRVSFNLVDSIRDSQHPKNERACVCQQALESEIEAGTLPDRSDATEQDRQQAVDQACRESFQTRASYPYADSPENYVARARNRYEKDLNQVVETRQRTEKSNRELAEDLRSAFDKAVAWLSGDQTDGAQARQLVFNAVQSLRTFLD